MKLPGKLIDANVILRFFLEDDKEQFIKAKSFIQRLELGNDEALVPDIVFAEVVWVLNKVYHVPRPEIAERLSKLLGYKGIRTLFSKEVYLESLKKYARQIIDIQDILLAVVARDGNSVVITFDETDFKKLNCKYSGP